MSNIRHWNIAVKGMAFDPQTGESYQMNDSARFIVEQLKEGRTPEEIATATSRRFGIAYERALTDVIEFVAQLQSMGAAA